MEFSSYFGNLHRLHNLKYLDTGGEQFAALQYIFMLSGIDFKFVFHCILCSSQSAFFHQHGCTTSDTNAKYNSRAAQLYKEKIKSLATQATRKHGTDVSNVCLMQFRFFKNFLFFTIQSNFKLLVNVKDYLPIGGTGTRCSEVTSCGVNYLPLCCCFLKKIIEGRAEPHILGYSKHHLQDLQ